MYILTAENIHKEYVINGKKLPILRGVDVEVKEKEILVIKGPSGAGKSTLLHILGLLDMPTEGVVRLDGRVLGKKNGRVNAKRRAKDIGFVFQFYNLLNDFTVLENVCLPWMIANGRFLLTRRVRTKAEEILNTVGLSHRLRHRPAELSGGEQQRASIARAIINDPRLVLADEPTGNLDSENADKVWRLLTGLREEHGRTVVIVTHSEELARKGDRTLSLLDGKIEKRM